MLIWLSNYFLSINNQTVIIKTKQIHSIHLFKDKSFTHSANQEKNENISLCINHKCCCSVKNESRIVYQKINKVSLSH